MPRKGGKAVEPQAGRPSAHRGGPQHHRFAHGGGHAQQHDPLRRARHHGARRPPRGGRAQARAAAHPLYHERAGHRPRHAPPQVRAHRGRLPGQISPARRQLGLRGAGAHGAGFQHARAAGGRPRELRQRRRRRRGRHALHRGAHDPAGGGDAARHRQGYRALPAQLRRHPQGAGHAARELPKPAGQRGERHRRGPCDQHPAAQPARDHRGHGGADRQPGHFAGRVDEAGAGAGLSHRGRAHRHAGAARRLRDGARKAHAARPHAHRGRARRAKADRRHRDSLSGEQGGDA